MTLHETKVVIDVGVTRLQDELGMTFGVDARLVDPGVQGGVIDVVDLLTRSHVMVELGALVRPPQKASRGLRGSTNSREATGLLEAGPLAFPHFNDVVALGAKTGHFVLGPLVNVMHGTFQWRRCFFVTYRITLGTSVPETPVEFADGVGLVMEAIHGEGGTGYLLLADIAYVLNVMALGGMRMILVGAPSGRELPGLRG